MKLNQQYREVYERVTEMSRFYHRVLPEITRTAPESRPDDTLRQSLLHYKNKYLKNIDHLTRAAWGFFTKGNLVPAYLMTRSALEQFAFLHLLYDHLRSGKLVVSKLNTPEAHKSPARLHFSAFPAKRLDLLLSRKNCQMAIRNLDQAVNGVRWQYQALNEFLSQHPAGIQPEAENALPASMSREEQRDYQLTVGLTTLFNLLTMTMAVNDDFVDLLEKQLPRPLLQVNKMAS